MLFHATMILLHRPILSFTTSTDPLELCRAHLVHAYTITRRFDETFGANKMSYISMYCSFVCASLDILLLNLETEKVGALERLQGWLVMLDKVSVDVSPFRLTSRALFRALVSGIA